MAIPDKQRKEIEQYLSDLQERILNDFKKKFDEKFKKGKNPQFANTELNNRLKSPEYQDTLKAIKTLHENVQDKIKKDPQEIAESLSKILEKGGENLPKNDPLKKVFNTEIENLVKNNQLFVKAKDSSKPAM